MFGSDKISLYNISEPTMILANKLYMGKNYKLNCKYCYEASLGKDFSNLSVYFRVLYRNGIKNEYSIKDIIHKSKFGTLSGDDNADIDLQKILKENIREVFRYYVPNGSIYIVHFVRISDSVDHPYEMYFKFNDYSAKTIKEKRIIKYILKNI